VRTFRELRGAIGGILGAMKPIVWVRHLKIATTGDQESPLGQQATVSRLTLADKAAFLVLAAGLLALGGVLFAAGLVVLLALAAAGVAIGGATVLRNRLFGQPRTGLRPGEIVAAGEVLPGPAVRVLPSSPAPPPPAGHERAPRAD
jgi:hypothetical protein